VSSGKRDKVRESLKGDAIAIVNVRPDSFGE
jgi:hypothetical protein